MVGKDDHIVAVLYHRDLAKHPNVLIQSEDSQDQRTQFFSDFAGLEATKHQVTQNQMEKKTQLVGARTDATKKGTLLRTSW